MISFESPIIRPILLPAETNTFVAVSNSVCIQMCFPTTTTHVLCLQSGCLSIGLTCLHASGPLAAPWLPLIDLFQEPPAACRLEIKEGKVGGVNKKRVILLGYFFGFSFVLVAPMWVCKVGKPLERYEELPNALCWCMIDFFIGSHPSSHFLNFIDVNINLHEWDIEAKLCWKFLKIGSMGLLPDHSNWKLLLFSTWLWKKHSHSSSWKIALTPNSCSDVSLTGKYLVFHSSIAPTSADL